VPPPPVFGLGADHFAHGENPVFVEEHVLGAAKADALRAEIPRLLASRGVSALCPDTQLPGRISPRP
jgi:hypothetical protein